MNKKQAKKFKNQRLKLEKNGGKIQTKPELSGEMKFLPGADLEKRIKRGKIDDCLICKIAFSPEELERANIIALTVEEGSAAKNKPNAYFVHVSHLLDKNGKHLPSYDLNIEKIKRIIRSREVANLKVKKSKSQKRSA